MTRSKKYISTKKQCKMYQEALAIHLLSVIAWCQALFGLALIHDEVKLKYVKIFAIVAMFFTFSSGGYLISINFSVMKSSWFYLKMFSLVALIITTIVLKYKSNSIDTNIRTPFVLSYVFVSLIVFLSIARFS